MLYKVTSSCVNNSKSGITLEYFYTFIPLSLFFCLILFAGCAPMVEPIPSENSALQSSRKHYSCETLREDFAMTLTNFSPLTMEVVGACDFLVYRRTQGWDMAIVVARRTSPVAPECYQPFSVAPGQTQAVLPIVELPAGTMQICNETYYVGAPFTVHSTGSKPSAKLGMMYAQFDVGESPTGNIGGLSLAEVTFNSLTNVTVQNHKERGKIWLIPFCSHAAQELDDLITVTGFYPYATLEHRTAWGTWEVLIPDRDTCTQNMDQIGIEAQSQQDIMLWRNSGFDWQQLEAGWYRWHIVYFSEQYDHSSLFTSGFHRFLEEFQIKEGENVLNPTRKP